MPKLSQYRSALGFAEEDPTGRGIRIAIIDTGIDTRHPDLSDAYDRRKSLDVRRRWFRRTKRALDDREGHGTAMAGLIAGSGALLNGRFGGIAPDAPLVIIKVSDDSSYHGPEIGRALEALMQADVDIAYCAVGWGGSDRASPWVWPALHPLESKFRSLSESGILFFLPAGNEGQMGQGTINFPAALTSVYAVGACDSHGRLWPDSSRGPAYLDPGATNTDRTLPHNSSHIRRENKPDFVTLGTEIISPLTRYNRTLVRESRAHVPELLGRYQMSSGTSHAAAVAAGIAACGAEWLVTKRGITSRSQRATVLREVITNGLRSRPPGETPADYGSGMLRWPEMWSALQNLPS